MTVPTDPTAPTVPPMIWANSGDSHLLEPADLFFERMPRALAERMPRSVKDPDGAWETLHIDGNSFRRRLPTRPLTDESGLSQQDKAPGAFDPVQRLKDLDREGIWAELIYPSISMWTSSLTDPDLLREGVRVINDWAMEFQAVSPRFVCTAHLPLLSIPDAVAEVRRTHEMGFRAAFFPVEPPPSQPRFNQDEWEPLWAALEETGLVMAVHIGTEAHDAGVINGQYHRGPGGAVLNYFETSFGGQRIAAQMITSGALDRHPGLRVMISEGGATWGPFLADRMDEGYRQHSSAVRPRLSRLPSEFLFSQVYASFQHDSSAVAAMSAMGWNNVCWGSDYPHIEGTFGHTQKTLAGLFDGADIAVRDRITVGTFEELFPHVPPVPGERLP